MKYYPPFITYKEGRFPNGTMTQGFGENIELYRRFGFPAGHNGIDLVAPHGTLLHAVEDAIVVDVNDNPQGYGKHLRLHSLEKDGNLTRQWVYAHNDTQFVKVGQTVKRGEPICTMGNTGFVVSGNTPFWQYNPFAGTHLHIGMRYVNEGRGTFSYPGSDITFTVKDYNNGYHGYVDIEGIFEEKDVKGQLRASQLTVIGLLNKLIKRLS